MINWWRRKKAGFVSRTGKFCMWVPSWKLTVVALEPYSVEVKDISELKSSQGTVLSGNLLHVEWEVAPRKVSRTQGHGWMAWLVRQKPTRNQTKKIRDKEVCGKGRQKDVGEWAQTVRLFYIHMQRRHWITKWEEASFCPQLLQGLHNRNSRNSRDSGYAWA